MGIDDPTRQFLDRVRRQDLHESGQNYEFRFEDVDRGDEAVVPFVTGGEILELHDRRGNAGRTGNVQPPCLGVVADNRDDTRAVTRLTGSAENRVHGRSGSGDQDDNGDRLNFVAHALSLSGRPLSDLRLTVMASETAEEPQALRARTSIRIFMWCLGSALLLSFAPLPWGLVGAIPAVAAVVAAVVAVVRVRAVATTATWVLLTVGGLSAGYLSLTYASSALLYDELMEYDECRSAAITVAAKARCDEAFEETSEQRFEELQEQVSGWFGGS